MNVTGLQLDLELMLEVARDMKLKPAERKWAREWAQKIQCQLTLLK